MLNLVSIIIPCFNAEQWIAEAIESCLLQSYPFIEIIVIDDGSTDKSLNIIKSYDNNIFWETNSNKGGNYARNRGFTRSKGKYIQFLDADDYILPSKIEHQVNFLEKTKADVVYGDWRHQRHLSNGNILLEDIQLSGKQQDILESLLANWWVAPVALLFRREIIQKTGSWNENIKVGQDRDFLLTLAMNDARIIYQPGCYSIYRRYGNITVSTSSKIKYLENHHLIIKKAENQLLQKGTLSMKYRQALAQSYFELARGYLDINQPKNYSKLLEKILDIFPAFQVNNRHSKSYRLAQNILGFRQTERIYKITKYIKSLFRY